MIEVFYCVHHCDISGLHQIIKLKAGCVSIIRQAAISLFSYKPLHLFPKLKFCVFITLLRLQYQFFISHLT
jgi:hypothetical protein